ncbi:tetratricopeptide repeat protein [Vibrio sp. HN007]|uniref:tetratricopeptide repeat protein n=1 Tax=Vibrio iocasae TaxID=3098914 RepID=UPI0035D46D1D
MISNKWLELYQHINEQIEVFPKDIEPLLSKRLDSLKVQFKSDRKPLNREQLDWLESEAFTMVMADTIQNSELNHEQVSFLFDTTLAAQLGQLSLAVVNSNKALLSKDDIAQMSGLAYQQLGDYDLAKQMFEETIEHHPDSGLAHCYLGFVYLHLSDTEQAKNCFLKSIEVAPTFIGGYQNLAGLYYQERQFEKATDYAEQAYQQEQTLAATYITAISAYLALGEKEQADNWVNRAFQHQVTSIELVRLAGITAHQNGRLEEALEALDHYLEAKPESFDVLSIRARLKSELGLYQEMESDLKQLLTLEPYDEWCLEHLFLAYFHTSQWQNAQLVMVDLNKLAAHYKVTYREQINLINQKLNLDVVELN